MKSAAPSVRCGFIQHRMWTSTTRVVCRELSPIVTSSQCGFCTKSGAPYDDEYPPLPAYQSDSETEKKEVYIVQVKGLPWSCSAQDVLQFFSECRIRDGVKGIHLPLDRLGRPSGRAFIEMEHEVDVSKALEKHRQYLGPRYVEVYEVTNSDAEAILKKAALAPAGNGVVRLRGLPFSCTEADIIQFFSGLDIMENGITIITDHRGRITGEAFVQFFSQTAADEALQRDRAVIGTRYIEVFPSNSDEIHAFWGRRRMMTTGPAHPWTDPWSVSSTTSTRQTNPRAASAPPASLQSTTVPLHYVHMRGLPFWVSGEDIVKFFSPLIVSKILIDCSPDGRPNGEADVYFNCHKDAVAAMSRDRRHIGERYVELFLNSDSNAR